VRAELEYGVTDRVQATVELPYGVRDPAGEPSVNGLEDLELGFRYALLDFRTRPLALDVGLTLGLPHERPAELLLAAERDRWEGGGGGRARVRRRAPLSMARVVPHPRGGGRDGGERDGLLCGPRARLEARQHLELLVAVPVGLTGAAADYGVIAGITIEIERLTGRGQRAD
jgi:hypothetical protein